MSKVRFVGRGLEDVLRAERLATNLRLAWCDAERLAADAVEEAKREVARLDKTLEALRAGMPKMALDGLAEAPSGLAERSGLELARDAMARAWRKRQERIARRG